MTDTPTLAEMIFTNENAAKTYSALFSVSPAEAKARDAHRATAALLRNLSDPSDETLERMAIAFANAADAHENLLPMTAEERRGFMGTGKAGIRAALSALLTGEASDDYA